MGPEKRLPLALFLCFVILFGWSALNAPEPPLEGEGEVPPVTAVESAGAAAAAETAGSDEASTPGPEGGASEDGAFEDGASEDGAPGAGPSEAEAEAEATASDVEAWSEWVELGAEGERGHAFARFDSLGGSVAELRLGGYFVRQGLSEEERAEMENRTPIVQPVITPEQTFHSFMLRPGVSASALLSVDPSAVHWEHRAIPGGVEFTHRDAGGLTLVKTIEHVPGEFQLRIGLEVLAENEAVAGKRATLGFVASAGMRAEGNDSFYQEPKGVAALLGKEPEEHLLDEDGDPRQDSLVSSERTSIEFLGTHNKYFTLLARPSNDLTVAILDEANWQALYDMPWVVEGGEPLRGFRDLLVEGILELTTPNRGASTDLEFVSYYGPKSRSAFGPGDEAYAGILQKDLGFFDGIAGVILQFLDFLHGLVGNWGIAIIILTLCVRSLLFPLNRRMQTSMARHATKMKRVQPKIDAVKKKYEDDPKRLRQEQARIFQEEGAMPPIGGCLPVFLQIPIFFGLFSALRVSFDLRQEPFMGWIKDLSQPDQLFRMDLPVPIIGPIEYFNLLPILMVVLWIAQQKVVPKPATDNEQARQMQKMMMWMPILFGVFLYNYAAGLSLYMITTSAFGIMEYTVIRRIWPIDDSEQPRKKSRWMEKLEQLQKQAVAQQEAQRRAGQGRGGAGRKKR